MIRRFALLLALPLLLTACGGSSSSSSACKDQYWDGTIGLCLPTGWNVVDRETLDQRGVPQEVVAAFQAEKAVSGQFPTVTVTKEALSSPADTSAYSQASIRSVSTLPGYKLIDSRTAKVDGAATEIHVFTAQPINQEPERRFYQVSAVSGQDGYTLTALAPLSITSAMEKDLTAIMQSLTFKEPGVTGGAASSK